MFLFHWSFWQRNNQRSAVLADRFGVQCKCHLRLHFFIWLGVAAETLWVWVTGDIKHTSRSSNPAFFSDTTLVARTQWLVYLTDKSTCVEMRGIMSWTTTFPKGILVNQTGFFNDCFPMTARWNKRSTSGSFSRSNCIAETCFSSCILPQVWKERPSIPPRQFFDIKSVERTTYSSPFPSFSNLMSLFFSWICISLPRSVNWSVRLSQQFCVSLTASPSVRTFRK